MPSKQTSRESQPSTRSQGWRSKRNGYEPIRDESACIEGIGWPPDHSGLGDCTIRPSRMHDKGGHALASSRLQAPLRVSPSKWHRAPGQGSPAAALRSSAQHTAARTAPSGGSQLFRRSSEQSNKPKAAGGTKTTHLGRMEGTSSPSLNLHSK